MRIKPIASNMTELVLNDGTQVLFSYETPVACILPNGQYVRTLKKWSVTTSKHIGKWYKFTTYDVEKRAEMPQEYFDNLVKGV
jgi:hypothetical protein